MKIIYTGESPPNSFVKSLNIMELDSYVELFHLISHIFFQQKFPMKSLNGLNPKMK